MTPPAYCLSDSSKAFLMRRCSVRVMNSCDCRLPVDPMRDEGRAQCTVEKEKRERKSERERERECVCVRTPCSGVVEPATGRPSSSTHRVSAPDIWHMRGGLWPHE
jgi:hypothetical protein